MQKQTTYAANTDLKAILKAQRITQVQLAENIQVSTTTVKSILRGNGTSADNATKIASVLGSDLDNLFQPSSETKTLSEKTVLHYHRLISVILQTAVEWQYIPANPAERVKPPKVTHQEAEYLDDQQSIHLLELLQDQPIYYKTAVEVLLFTGMRRGELLGLTWQDIDFDRHTISIQRSAQYLPDVGVFMDETKTKSSNRVIKVPSSAISSLRSFRTWQQTTFLRIGQPWGTDLQVFTTQNGTPMHPDTLTSWFHDFIQKTDLPNIHIHSLRHTNATLQIANGVSVTTVAGNLGHSNANTTTRVYAHAIKSAQAAAADLVDDLLSSRNKYCG